MFCLVFIKEPLVEKSHLMEVFFFILDNHVLNNHCSEDTIIQLIINQHVIVIMV